MAIDFPNSPAPNDTYTFGDKTWIYADGKWTIAFTSTMTLTSLNVTGDVTVDTSTLKVDATNNRVGIGTASPLVTLDVSGAASISGNLTVDTSTFSVDATNNRVGIGTTSPTTALQVNGTATATAFAGPLTGDVTGNVSGTAATVTGAAQTSITSVGTLTGLTVTNAINGTLIKTVTGTNTADLIYGNMADNDQFRIRIGGTASNAGYVEIATSDDATEPIYVRQYTQVGGVPFTTLTRTATLLDGSGNTIFPGTVTAPTFFGALSGNASTATNLTSNRTNWPGEGTISAVVGQLAWKNYGGNHTIFDASNSTSPSGGAVNNTNAAVAWAGTYPTLMGWNGTSTYGVRVDSARNADNTTGNAATATTAATVTGAAQTSITSLGTLTSLTVDGPSSAAFTLGDWPTNANYGGIVGNMGYLLVGNNSGDTAMYLRTSTAGVVHIGANGSNTLSVGNGTILQTGSTTLAANNTYQCAALPAFGFNAWAGVSSYNFYNASDIRYKANIEELPLGLHFIKLLNPIKFTYVYPEFDEDSDIPTSTTEGTRLRAGLSAQNVKESLNAVGAGDFNLWALADKDNPESFQALDYTGLIAPIIQALKEIDAKVTLLMERIEALENK